MLGVGNKVAKFKKPQQDQSAAPFKVKEMLDFGVLSATAAKAYRDAMGRAAANVRYTGSPYHRVAAARMGPVAARAGHPSRCPEFWNNVEATRVLREAILIGRVSIIWENGYPRYAWHPHGDVLYEARLTNSGNGEYHAYPLEDERQWPKNYR